MLTTAPGKRSISKGEFVHEFPLVQEISRSKHFTQLDLLGRRCPGRETVLSIGLARCLPDLCTGGVAETQRCRPTRADGGPRVPCSGDLGSRCHRFLPMHLGDRADGREERRLRRPLGPVRAKGAGTGLGSWKQCHRVVGVGSGVPYDHRCGRPQRLADVPVRPRANCLSRYIMLYMERDQWRGGTLDEHHEAVTAPEAGRRDQACALIEEHWTAALHQVIGWLEEENR